MLFLTKNVLHYWCNLSRNVSPLYHKCVKLVGNDNERNVHWVSRINYLKAINKFTFFCPLILKHRQIMKSFSSSNVCQTLASIRTTWRSCSNPDCWALPPEFLIQQIWDGAWEFAFLRSSQVLLMLPILRTTLWKPLTYVTQCHDQMEKPVARESALWSFQSLPVVWYCSFPLSLSSFLPSMNIHRAPTIGQAQW